VREELELDEELVVPVAGEEKREVGSSPVKLLEERSRTERARRRPRE
jgi:hypothetical protein